MKKMESQISSSDIIQLIRQCPYASAKARTKWLIELGINAATAERLSKKYSNR